MDEKFSHVMLLLLFVWWQWRGNLALAQRCLCISILRAHRMVMMVTAQLERTDIIHIHPTVQQSSSQTNILLSFTQRTVTKVVIKLTNMLDIFTVHF
jgi:hypothetical protein